MRDLPDLAPLIDHALLDPHQGRESVLRCCDEAKHFGFGGVCLASRWLDLARERLGPSGGRGPTLISVIGFPFGAIPAQIKRQEAEWAAAAGADELDVVPDFGALADGNSAQFCEDLAPIADLGLPFKVILEVGRLTPEVLEWAVEASIDVAPVCSRPAVALDPRRASNRSNNSANSPGGAPPLRPRVASAASSRPMPSSKRAPAAWAPAEGWP